MLNDMFLLEPNAVAVAANAFVCGLDGTYLSITTHIEIYFLLLFEWPE